MKKQAYHYSLYLSGHKQPIKLSQMTGEKLIMATMSESGNRKVLIGDNMINKSFIISLEKEESFKIEKMYSPTLGDYDGEVLIEREQTEEEEKVHKEFLKAFEDKKEFKQLK